MTFAAAEQAEDALCPQGYMQNNINLNDGAGGMVIYTCFTKDPEAGAPITGMLAVTGLLCMLRHQHHHTHVHAGGLNASCPEGYTRINQDLNEGTTQHQYCIFMCITRLVRSLAHACSRHST